MKEGIVPGLYTVIKETPDDVRIDDIKGIDVLSTIDSLNTSIVTLTQEGSLASLLKLSRRGFQLSHVVSAELTSTPGSQK